MVTQIAVASGVQSAPNCPGWSPRYTQCFGCAAPKHTVSAEQSVSLSHVVAQSGALGSNGGRSTGVAASSRIAWMNASSRSTRIATASVAHAASP